MHPEVVRLLRKCGPLQFGWFRATVRICQCNNKKIEEKRLRW